MLNSALFQIIPVFALIQFGARNLESDARLIDECTFNTPGCIAIH